MTNILQAGARIVLILAGLFPAIAMAATPVAAGSQAQILEKIQFAVLLDMNLGQVATTSNTTGGVLDFNPSSGNLNCDPVLVCVGSHALSQLRVMGSDANIAINYDPSFQLTGPGDPMTAEPQFPGGQGSIITLTGGLAVVYFGARLHVNPGQAPGIYSGTFSVNLEYY